METTTIQQSATARLKTWFAANRAMLAASSVAAIEAEYSGYSDDLHYDRSWVSMTDWNAPKYRLSIEALNLLSQAVEEVMLRANLPNECYGGGSLFLDVMTGEICHLSHDFAPRRHDNQEIAL